MFDVSNLTLNAQEVQRASELIVEKGFKKGRLAELFDIQTGISFKQQILSAKRIGVGGGAPTGCVPKSVGDIGFSEKFWEPALVTGRLSYCASDENRLFKILSKWKNVYPEFFEQIPDEVMQVVVALLLDHMESSIIAKAFFSDLAADTVANGGVFANGTDLSIFNQFNGIFKQIDADNTIPVYTIDKNSGNSYANQKITAQEAYDAIEGVFDNADERLKGDPEAVIYVTSDVYWGYLKKIAEIEGAGGVVKTTVGGRQAVSYMGKTVVNMVDWSDVIHTYQDDGSKYNLPHRIIFTTKANMPIGTLSKKDLQNLRTAYDVGDNKVYTDYGYFLDAKFVDSYLMSVGI